MKIVSDDPDWECEDKRRQIRVTKSSGMSKPELLIVEYNLTDWMSKTYKGSDPTKIAIPVLSESYRGITRVKHDVLERGGDDYECE